MPEKKTAPATERFQTSLWQNLMKVRSPACPVKARVAFQSKPAFITIDVATSRVECASSIGARMPNVWYATAIPTLSQWGSLWETGLTMGFQSP